MSKVNEALKKLSFRWKPKHLNHIAENIVFKNRNISFLAINALFRYSEKKLISQKGNFQDSYLLKGNPGLLKNDRLRTKSEDLFVIFRLDQHQNIIVITAYSENDEEN